MTTLILHTVCSEHRERMRLNLQPQAGPEDARKRPVTAPRVALTAVEAEEDVEVQETCHELRAKLVTHYSKAKHNCGWTRMHK